MIEREADLELLAGDGIRKRWFGASGRRVHQIAVEGTIELAAAWVVDELPDLDELRLAFLEGCPVVVRCSTAEEVLHVLRRPEVSCALVPADRADLLQLDLVQLTYGSSIDDTAARPEP